ncbi:MAG: DNA mismatch repair protein MutS [Arcicella sp.]|jgi:DNA mismatch repair ATPase MutS|nr:DNA mismatch repair protein MutS [Arcicella sp.]
MSPLQTFQSRKEKFSVLAEDFQKKYNQWAVFRAALFISVGIISYVIEQFFNVNYVVLVLVIGIALFLFSINKHLKVKYLRDKNKVLSAINNDELKRLDNVFVRSETGEQFVEDNHFYTHDLDIFGKHSLYKLLNRTYTYTGGFLLADWLKKPTTQNNILNRQQAVEELSSKIDFRQELQASAALVEEVSEPTAKLLAWNQQPENELIKKPVFQYGKYLPFVTVPLILAWAFDVIPIGYPLLMLLVHGFILKQIYQTVSVALDQTLRFSATLRAYANLSDLIVQEKLETQSLRNLQEQLSGASPAIRVLEDILNKLGNRSNPFFAFIVGIPLLWDVQYFIKLEHWKKQHRDSLSVWLYAIAEVEALNSLAGLHFANPTFTKPVISDQHICLKTRKIAHPMIHQAKRVANDIELVGEGQTIIITGSNMSGKSTFQRTVGVNIVLALAGAVVCAEAFECSCMRVFTSMRTQDSLEEGTSSFYAELKRLKLLIETVRETNSFPIFYFLDEILKGTNSKDRHEGAKALMLQLHRTSASGFISTHDVELGDEFENESFVRNYSFSSEVKNHDLVFDYQLRAGVCHSFNASMLMKGIGIEI